ncbi:MAG: hypothetical protein Q4A62_02890 [Eikenella sp.]|nr:hypothetical protein [Eikenella sp.]
MKDTEIKIDSFNVKYSFWASIFTVFILFPTALSIFKLMNIDNTASQTRFIILLLSIIFGFLIIVMKSTMKEVCLIKYGENILIKDGNNIEIKLDEKFHYNLYHYHSRKVFMIRILDKNKSYFYLSPDTDLKNDMEAFLPESNKHKNSLDFYAQIFPLVLCLAYFILSVVFII